MKRKTPHEYTWNQYQNISWQQNSKFGLSVFWCDISYGFRQLVHCTMGLSEALWIWNILKCEGIVFAQFWSNTYQSSSNSP